MFDYVAYAALVKQKRGALKLSQENLAADALGDPARKSEISRIETGKTKPNENTIQKLNAALKISEAEMASIRQSRVTAKDLDNLPALDRDDLELLATRFQIANAPDLQTRELRDLLHEKAKDYRALRKEVDELKVVSPRLANQHAAAMDALDNLRIEEAEEILANAREIVTEQLREPLEINAQLMEAQAAAALTRGDVEAAYTLLSTAADSFGVIDSLETARKRVLKYFEILRTHGLRYGGDGLSLSRDLLSSILTEDLKANDACLWAAGHDHLAIAFQNQGNRIGGKKGAELLDASVVASRAALTVFTETDHPVDWAMSKNNLAITLRIQGTRTAGAKGTRLLAEAVDALRAALSVRTKSDRPAEWAMTQNNLGNVLWNQGTRTRGEDSIHLFSEAVAAYLAALTVFTESDRPVDWATIQINLGAALRSKGIRTGGSDGAYLLIEAIAAYRAALTVYTKAEHPVLWAFTKENLAIVEESVADHDATPDPRPHLEAALAHVDAALTVFDPEHMSYNLEKATRLRDDLKARLAELD